MLECEVLFGIDYAAKVEAVLAQATGGPCPGRAGGQCPLTSVATRRIELHGRATTEDR